MRGKLQKSHYIYDYIEDIFYRHLPAILYPFHIAMARLRRGMKYNCKNKFGRKWEAIHYAPKPFYVKIYVHPFPLKSSQIFEIMFLIMILCMPLYYSLMFILPNNGKHYSGLLPNIKKK